MRSYQVTPRSFKLDMSTFVLFGDRHMHSLPSVQRTQDARCSHPRADFPLIFSSGCLVWNAKEASMRSSSTHHLMNDALTPDVESKVAVGVLSGHLGLEFFTS